MIKSMTGYGRARETRNKRDITVEVRSVNNRYLDCTVKMPRMYAFAEDAVKKHVQQAVSRGKSWRPSAARKATKSRRRPWLGFRMSSPSRRRTKTWRPSAPTSARFWTRP